MKSRSRLTFPIAAAIAVCLCVWWWTASAVSYRTTPREALLPRADDTEASKRIAVPPISRGGTASPTIAANGNADAVSRLKAAIEDGADDELVLRALVDLTRNIVLGNESEFLALIASVDDATNGERLRALLLLVVAQWADERATSILRRYAVSPDEVLSLVAVEGLLFRASLRCSPDVSDDFLSALWRGAFLDRRIGASIAPGFADSHAASDMSTPWTQVDLPDGDEMTMAELKEVAQRGQAVSARTFSIRKLPPSAATDVFLRSVTEDPTSPALVRAVAYEYMRKAPENWSTFAVALQRETDFRVLAGLCTKIDISSPDTKVATVQLLERLAPLAAQNSQLANRLSAALSFSESPEGVAALERMAQTGGSVDLRREAVCALTYCSYDSPMWSERMTALNRLATAQDPLTSAIAACVLLESCDNVSVRDIACRTINESFLARARQLAGMDQLPERIRVELTGRLRRFERK